MAIPWNVEDLPLLPEDYPLFDWADFPESYAALVPGGPTRNFKKEAWNAMVDKMADAVAVAGGSFDEGFWITEPYGKLYANHIDGLFLMYQEMTGLPDNQWPWNDRTSRAYLPYGYPLKGDKVYPEYLLYLFQRVNFLLELLKGNIELPDLKLQHRSATIAQAEFFPAVSAPISTQHSGQTDSSADVKAPAALPMSAQAFTVSNVGVTILPKRSAPVDVWQESRAKIQLAARVRPSVPAEVMVSGKSTVSAEIQSSPLKDASAQVNASGSSDVTVLLQESVPLEAQAAGGSTIRAEGSVGASHPMNANAKGFSHAAPNVCVEPSVPITIGTVAGKSASQAEVWDRRAVISDVQCKASGATQAELQADPSVPLDCQVRAAGSAEVEALMQPSLPMAVQETLSTAAQITVIKQRSRPAWAEEPSLSAQQAAVEKLLSASVAVQKNCHSMLSCSAEIWLLPLQPDRDTLHIRQTLQLPILVDDVLYIDLHPEQGVTDQGTLVLWQIWQDAVQIQDTLYIGAVLLTGMIDDDTLLIWTVSVNPVLTDDQLEVF